VLLTFGLQGLAEAAYPADADGVASRDTVHTERPDATWGIGRRIAAAPASLASAEEDAALTLAGLEKAFWACDYVATVRGVDATPVAVCTAVYDDLKDAKFAGDFRELLEWWKLNKAAEHAKLAMEEGSGAVERVDAR
jgi:hypothetical protein